MRNSRCDWPDGSILVVLEEGGTLFWKPAPFHMGFDTDCLPAIVLSAEGELIAEHPEGMGFQLLGRFHAEGATEYIRRRNRT